jgi:predicted Ser/Thr protein kinase
MPAVRATARGEAAIDAWTIHCPSCGHPVTVRAGDDAVACPSCRAAFSPEGLVTAAHPRSPANDTPFDPNDDLVGRTLGGWLLTRLIGRGGMGRVYEARGGRGNRRVALKVLSEDLAADPAFVKRFQREARVLASLSHPHVVEILDRGEVDGRIWFAMEYVRGENLRRRMERGRVSASEAVRIAREVSSALAYAHARGVVHRDLKPENVLLDEEGRVHLADFGLSRVAGGGATTFLTRTDVVLGTYEYMAPEQRRGDKDIDARADVFALGVILYEALTGQLPQGRFTLPSRLRSDVPASLDAVVNKALATERNARFATAEALASALEEAWSRRNDRPKAVPDDGSPIRVAPQAPVTLGEAEVARLKGMLVHVDVLSALDRVLGILLILGGLGILTGTVFFDTLFATWIFPLGSLALFVAGVIFLRLGTRLRGMRQGSRDAQITASVLLLLFPPVLTAIGLYGLVFLTGTKARAAFAVGRKPLEGPKPVVAQRVYDVVKEPRKAPPWVLLRLLMVVAVFWTIYAGAVAIDTAESVPTDTLANVLEEIAGERLEALKLSVLGALVSIVAFVAAFRVRHVRRGLGIAITSFLLFAGCAAVLSNVHHIHAISVTQESAPWIDNQPSIPRLENRR